MSRIYWVLAWDTYYPLGGLGNVQGTYETMEEAEAKASECQDYDFVQIVNIQEKVWPITPKMLQKEPQ